MSPRESELTRPLPGHFCHLGPSSIKKKIFTLASIVGIKTNILTVYIKTCSSTLNFFLVLKEITTFLWVPKSITGPKTHAWVLRVGALLLMR